MLRLVLIVCLFIGASLGQLGCDDGGRGRGRGGGGRGGGGRGRHEHLGGLGLGDIYWNRPGDLASQVISDPYLYLVSQGRPSRYPVTPVTTPAAVTTPAVGGNQAGALQPVAPGQSLPLATIPRPPSVPVPRAAKAADQ